MLNCVILNIYKINSKHIYIKKEGEIIYENFKNQNRKNPGTKKLTQREIATLLGCSPNFICMIWRGKNISPKTLGKIADALGVDPEDILEEEGK